MTDDRLKPGHCHKCGLPMSDNPHPEAGKPGHYLDVGCPRECIPCVVKSRHQWADRAMKAENELRDLQAARATQIKDSWCICGNALQRDVIHSKDRPCYLATTADEAKPVAQPQKEDAEVERFLAEVRAELMRARAKFPGDRIMGLALAEEFGELCKAMLDESAENVRKEAVQTAVMCARVVLDGDGSVIEWRKERGLDPLIAASAPKETT